MKSPCSSQPPIKQPDLRQLTLPASPCSIDTDEYQRVKIDRQSREFPEPLVDLASFNIATESFFSRTDGKNAPLYRHLPAALKKVYARRGIAERLQKANQRLLPFGAEILALDGYRPIAVQRELWNWFIEQAKHTLPHPSRQQCVQFALRYCSNPARFKPNDATTWPTHSTGGAVDVTLRDIASQKSLNMGGIYLDPSDVSSTRYYENLEVASGGQQTARRNRRLLFWAMSLVGFVNYPFEWWHFDHLTQAWVMNQGFPTGLKAHYGLANAGKAIPEK